MGDEISRADEPEKESQVVSSDWDRSAAGWIDGLGETGDYGRAFVLDPVMQERVRLGRYETALDIGCGEGRFTRWMQSQGLKVIGIDPTAALLDAARAKDPGGDYRSGVAERIGCADSTFDLVVSYLMLIDVADARAAIHEMARVLKPGGTLLIANLTSFNTSTAEHGSVRDENGAFLYYPVDRYLEERGQQVGWRNGAIAITNYHRPMKYYMQACLSAGLALTFFDEPAPVGGDQVKAGEYRRAPYFLVMEWRKAG